MRDEHEFDQWLRQELKRDAEYLSDGGFTDGVMAAIPAPRVCVWPSLGWTLILAVLAGVLALVLFPGWVWVYSLAAAIAGWSFTTIMKIGMAASLLMVLFTAALIWNEA